MIGNTEKQEFRAQVSAWMSENKPADPGFLLPQSFMEVGSEQQLEFLREWQHKVWSAGYLGIAWPRAYGGQGLDPVFQSIADQEMRRHGVPICFNVIGLGWAGPLINDIGSEADKSRYLKGILSGEDIWCQGFSEPDHGSDLVSVQTRAERDGDSYRVNGTKIWTTLGNFARYMILLARTDPAAPRKYDGLSFFLAPMQSEGIETRPIRKLTGEYGFTETFFTDAQIPASCRMGEEGEGWRIAMRTLMYERAAEAGAAGGLAFVRVVVDDLVDSLRERQRDGAPVLEDPLVRDALVQRIIEEKAILLGERRARIEALASDYPGSLALTHKLRFTESTRRLRQLAVALLGADGGLYVDDPGVPVGGFWQRAYLNSFAATIGGGTSQVQANIIAEQVLGLPR
ncbi:MAG: acyl-CoA dehydrogenase [Haliea sp.]|nr:acyl-CoA dehydrogenase [Haliea sp.]|tara:strand:+ start:159139 stop:160338 length:1200 start_codon:yes stop_codon:yes gene_type:complete